MSGLEERFGNLLIDVARDDLSTYSTTDVVRDMLVLVGRAPHRILLPLETSK